MGEGVGGRIRELVEDFVVEEIPKEVQGEGNIQFWIEKRNWDNNLALRAIAKALHCSASRIGVAGTKDKRAVTKQRISVFGISKEQVEKIEVPGIRIWGIEEGGRIRLGNLKGNKFEITIREIGLREKEIESRLRVVARELDMGIPNVFGEQRFGTVRAVTAEAGLAILKGKFEQAAKMYIAKVFDGEMEEAKKARDWVWKNWGKQEAYREALGMFPPEFVYERSMLDYLAQHPKDFVGCLRRLPFRVLKMLINAVQSIIWNRSLEKCWKKGVLIEGKASLPGYGTDLDTTNPLEEEIAKQLKGLGLKAESFAPRGISELRCTGFERAILIKPRIEWVIGEDEMNKDKSKVKIKFELPAGSYATVVLREIMKAAESKGI